jgi:hypothetical protein
MAIAMNAATATAIAGVDAVAVAAVVEIEMIAANALKAQPRALKHALRAKMAVTAGVQNAAIAMVNVGNELSAANAVKAPTLMATMLSTPKMSMP